MASCTWSVFIRRKIIIHWSSLSWRFTHHVWVCGLLLFLISTHIEGVPDLLSLGEFNEGALLHTVRERHKKNLIYTSIGTPILLSINPY